jgi:hypothetical protein
MSEAQSIASISDEYIYQRWRLGAQDILLELVDKSLDQIDIH